MPNFCVRCGAPLGGGSFCRKCGADARSVAPSVQPHSPPSVAQPPSPASTKQGMSTLAKLGIAAIAIIFVGGAAGAVGVYYVAHRVSQKYHEVSDEIRGSGSRSGSEIENGPGTAGSKDSKSTNSALGDVCRFLSKEEVSKAVGVEIVRTESKDNGCSYMAEGTQQDMTAKHLKAMVTDKGADKKTQEIAEKFARGMMNAFPTEKRASDLNTSGEVPVFTFSLDQHGAEEQMRLNAKMFGNLGNEEGLPGIGDQAFVSADGMILVRKGKTLVRIMYLACPCGVEQVKPLAKEIADAL